MNLSTISDAWKVFEAGESVANPTAWKKGQVTANMIGIALAAAVVFAKDFGYDLHLDDNTIAGLSAGIFALVNWVCTVVSTEKIGVIGNASEPKHDPSFTPRVDWNSGQSEQSPEQKSEPAAQPNNASIAQPADGAAADKVRLGDSNLSRQDNQSMLGGG